MPSGIVKTPRDERLWRKAKKLAKKSGQQGNYAYITSIFKKLKSSASVKKSLHVRAIRAHRGAHGIYIDPEHLKLQRMAQEAPKRLTPEMMLETNIPVLRLDDIARGVGLNFEEQDRVTRGLTGIMLSANEVVFRRQAYLFLGDLDSLDPYQKKIVMERAIRYYKRQAGNLSKAGPYIGPRGGKWEDPQHTIPWHESKEVIGEKLDALDQRTRQKLIAVAKQAGWTANKKGTVFSDGKDTSVLIMCRGGKWFVEVGPTQDPSERPKDYYTANPAYVLRHADGKRGAARYTVAARTAGKYIARQAGK